MLIKLLFKCVLIIGKLSFTTLYIFSAILGNILQVFSYRKKVIMYNLDIAFPNKTIAEKKKICATFYHNFSDSIFESIKMLTEKASHIHQHHSHLINLYLLHQKYAEDKEIFLLMPHIFNWEWIGFWAITCPQKNVYAAYKPLKNKYLNEKLEQARFRVGGKGIPAKSFFGFVENAQHSRDNLFVVVADQSPHISKIRYSTQLFGKETAAFNGYDELLRKRKSAVIYCKPYKVKQGYYTYEFIEIKPDNQQFKPNEVVNKFFILLENSIKEQPANWLWSHKRWKYNKGKDF